MALDGCRREVVVTLPSARRRFVVFGAGVLGSLYAARLAAAGYDVTLVARGRRLADLREHGLIVEDAASGERSVTRSVRFVDAIPPGETFACCLVLVRTTQLAEALPVLAEAEGVATFVVMVNNAEGPDEIVRALGRERVLLGFANAGGERDGEVVRVMVSRRSPVTLGELDGRVSERLTMVAQAFRDAGAAVRFESDMDAWLRHHVAVVGPFANALYAVGTDNRALAADRDTLRLALRAVREAVGVVRAHGHPVRPPVLRALLAIPDALVLPLLRRLVALPIMDVGGARHARAARDEMDALNAELAALARSAGVDTPAMDALASRAAQGRRR